MLGGLNIAFLQVFTYMSCLSQWNVLRLALNTNNHRCVREYVYMFTSHGIWQKYYVLVCTVCTGLVQFLIMSTAFFSGAHVSNVSPDYGSLGGETRITITGGGKN